MTLPQRSWPYGTRKKVRIAKVLFSGKLPAVIAVEGGEAWVLLGIDLGGVEENQEREIVFREGGPKGGYWDFERKRTCGNRSDGPYLCGLEVDAAGRHLGAHIHEDADGKMAWRNDNEASEVPRG